MANTDSRSMDELEEKKWLISRIDLYHKTMIDAWQNDLQKYESYGDKGISTAKSKRNNILTVLGFFLTVFLGYTSSYHVDQFLFFIVVTILGIIGLVVITFFNFAIKLIEDFFSSFAEITTEGIGKLAHSHGYFITRPARLPNVTISFANNYYYFVMLLATAIMVSASKSLRKLAKDYSRIPKMKLTLLNEAKEYEKNTQFIPFYYGKLDRSQDVPTELLEFVDKTLVDYRPKN